MKIDTENISEVVIVNSGNKVIATYSAKRIGFLHDSIDPQLIIEIANESKTSTESEDCPYCKSERTKKLRTLHACLDCHGTFLANEF